MDQLFEARLNSLEAAVSALQKELKEKDAQLGDLLDIEAIKRLQCAYGYYLEHWMSEEIIGLFADHPDVSATFVEGTYLGLEGVRRYFGKMKVAPTTFLHQVMQVSPVITLGEDRTTAKGRWFGYGTICSALAGGNIDPMYMSVIYEMDYIKEAGVWKILKLAFQMHYAYKTPMPASEKAENPPHTDSSEMKLSPDIWAEHDTQYPSGYIYPMHFKHPVTGKETGESAYNAALDLKPNRFRPV